MKEFCFWVRPISNLEKRYTCIRRVRKRRTQEFGRMAEILIFERDNHEILDPKLKLESYVSKFLSGSFVYFRVSLHRLVLRGRDTLRLPSLLERYFYFDWLQFYYRYHLFCILIVIWLFRNHNSKHSNLSSHSRRRMRVRESS